MDWIYNSRNCVLAICFVFICYISQAEDYKDDLNAPLSDLEMNLIHPPDSSPFRLIRLADSFSQIGDQINAGAAFLKIDPLFFIFIHQTPESIPNFIKTKFKISKESKDRYISIFNESYYGKKHEPYTKFKEMYEEDQNIRNKGDSCRDSACYSLNFNDMVRTDTMHFNYLYKYIIEHGWPTIAEGSLYASVIAVHDHEHHESYIRLLRKGVIEGQVDPGILRLVNNWYLLQKRYDMLNEHIVRGTYYKFDVSEMLNNEMPISLDTIRTVVLEKSPVTIFYVYECGDLDLFTEISSKLEAVARDRDVLALLNADLLKYNNNATTDEVKYINDGLWAIHWRATAHTDPRFFLYITYDRKDTVIRNFNKLIRDKKFITHPIHFEENKSSILNVDVEFLNQLVVWLKKTH